MAERTRPPSSEIKALVRRIRSVDEVTPWVKVCPYGPNGSGKTRLAASFPDCLIVDCNEEGTRSAAGQATGAKVIEAKTWADVGNTYWYLKSGKHKYQSVAIDTITAMHELAMTFVLGEAEERDPTRERSMPDKRMWNRSGQLVKGMLLAYRNLPMHVIFTAQERTIRDEDTEEIVDITVDLPAGCRGTAMGCVGVMGRLKPKQVRVKKGGKRRTVWKDYLYVGPHEIMKTKDRTFRLGPVLASPSGTKIIEAWQTHVDEDEPDEEE